MIWTTEARRKDATTMPAKTKARPPLRWRPLDPGRICRWAYGADLIHNGIAVAWVRRTASTWYWWATGGRNTLRAGEQIDTVGEAMDAAMAFVWQELRLGRPVK